MKTRITLVLLAILISLWANLPGQIKIKNWTWNRPMFPKRDLNLKLGLDLQGGVHLAYSADVSKIPVSDQSAAVDSTRANIERRINLLGVSEPIIQTSKFLPSLDNLNIAVGEDGLKWTSI